MKFTTIFAVQLVALMFWAPLSHEQTPPRRGRIVGIGGVFFKSDHQKELYSWYEQHLDLRGKPNQGVVFDWGNAAKNQTAWAIFPRGSKYFDPSPSPWMINYIVEDLDALLERLKGEGVSIDPKRGSDSAGSFAWIYDSDGNKIELWEPAAHR